MQRSYDIYFIFFEQLFVINSCFLNVFYGTDEYVQSVENAKYKIWNWKLRLIIMLINTNSYKHFKTRKNIR